MPERLFTACGNNTKKESLTSVEQLTTQRIGVQSGTLYEVDLVEKYPDLDITQIDVASKEGSEMLLKCAKKFDLGNNIGVPLFCLGDKHIMGWSSSYRIKFDAYIRPFLKK